MPPPPSYLVAMVRSAPLPKRHALPRYSRASSALSVASIRQQFSNKENIQVVFGQYPAVFVNRLAVIYCGSYHG